MSGVAHATIGQIGPAEVVVRPVLAAGITVVVCPSIHLSNALPQQYIPRRALDVLTRPSLVLPPRGAAGRRPAGVRRGRHRHGLPGNPVHPPHGLHACGCACLCLLEPAEAEVLDSRVALVPCVGEFGLVGLNGSASQYLWLGVRASGGGAGGALAARCGLLAAMGVLATPDLTSLDLPTLFKCHVSHDRHCQGHMLRMDLDRWNG